jgi:hypothetical protein
MISLHKQRNMEKENDFWGVCPLSYYFSIPKSWQRRELIINQLAELYQIRKVTSADMKIFRHFCIIHSRALVKR